MAANSTQQRSSSSSNSRTGSADVINPAPHTRIEDEEILASIYSLEDTLGQGSFGVVKKAKHNQTGTYTACKIVSKEKTGSMAMRMLEREVQILRQVKHPHLIHLVEVYETIMNQTSTAGKMFLFMEYCGGGDLKELLAKKKLEEFEAKIVLQRLSSAITYLHKKDIVHRDLKLENILLTKNPQDPTDKLYIKVTDFGLSCLKGGIDHENMLQDFCGTPLYMAPEIIENKSYSALCDVWAMGVIAFHLLVGYPPFQSSQEEKLYDIIRSANIQERLNTDDDWKTISLAAKKCVAGMLKVDPAHRMAAGEIHDHYWFTGQPENPNSHNVLELMKMVHAEDQLKRNGDGGEGGGGSVDVGGGTTDAENGTSNPSSRDGSANSKSSGTGTRRSSCPVNNNNNGQKTARKKNSEGSVQALHNRSQNTSSRLPPKAPSSTSSTSTTGIKSTRSPIDQRGGGGGGAGVRKTRSPGDTTRPPKATTPTGPRSSPNLHPQPHHRPAATKTSGNKTVATKTTSGTGTGKSGAGNTNKTAAATNTNKTANGATTGVIGGGGARKKVLR